MIPFWTKPLPQRYTPIAVSKSAVAKPVLIRKLGQVFVEQKSLIPMGKEKINNDSRSACRLETWSWHDRSTTIAKVRGKNFFVLNRPIRFISLIPSNAVGVAEVPTRRMLSNGSK